MTATCVPGVARAGPGWLLPPWTLCVIYAALALLLSACLAVVGLYGSFLSRAAVLQWLLSSLCAFLSSALLLEPLKVGFKPAASLAAPLRSPGALTALICIHSGVRAEFVPHSCLEACGSRGGGPAGPGDLRGEAVWRAQREGSASVRLRAPAGERRGTKSPSSALPHEGEDHICIFCCFSSLWDNNLILCDIICAALCVSAALPDAGADGELPGRRGADSGSPAALRSQTPASPSIPGGP